jgi:hypothetical protein
MKMKRKVTDIKEFVNILEEISWIIDRKSIDLSDMIKKVKVAIGETTNKSNEESITHLVGILPSLFMDKELFVKNDDLLDFAEQILRLKAKRSGNRSRTESIGWIVCELSKSDECIRKDFLDALDELVGNEEKKNTLKKKRQMPNFSWNDAIAKLNEESL